MQVISTTGRLLNVANSIIKASLQNSTRIVELLLDANSFNYLFILFREILRTYCLPFVFDQVSLLYIPKWHTNSRAL